MNKPPDPTHTSDGASSPHAGKRPRDEESLPEGSETEEQEAARDTERALERGITRLPPG